MTRVLSIDLAFAENPGGIERLLALSDSYVYRMERLAGYIEFARRLENPNGKVAFRLDDYSASGSEGPLPTVSVTITVSGTPVADETMVLAGVTFTFKASASTESEITISADNTVQATNITAKINAHSKLGGIIAATSAAGVVTMTHKNNPRYGALLVVSEAATGVAVSAASFAASGTATNITSGVVAKGVV